MNLKEYLAMDAAVEDDSLFSQLGEASKGAISGAKDGLDGTQKNQSLEQHDKRFHPQGYKKGDTCKFRETLKEENSSDDLLPGKKSKEDLKKELWGGKFTAGSMPPSGAVPSQENPNKNDGEDPSGYSGKYKDFTGESTSDVTKSGRKGLTYTATKCNSLGEFDDLMRGAFMRYGDDEFWMEDVSEDDPFFKKMEELNPEFMDAWKNYQAKRNGRNSKWNRNTPAQKYIDSVNKKDKLDPN